MLQNFRKKFKNYLILAILGNKKLPISLNPRRFNIHFLMSNIDVKMDIVQDNSFRNFSSIPVNSGKNVYGPPPDILLDQKLYRPP